MWWRFLISFAITGGTALVLCLALILLADPFGEAPPGVALTKSGYAIKDRRFLAPQVIDSGRFDSFLVGTSTIHSIDPAWADAALGGRFANVSIHGTTPYEMSQVLQLMARRVPGLKRIVLGLDVGQWCQSDAPPRHNAKALFPDWLYDDSRANDFTSILNLQALRLSLRQLEIALDLRKPAVPANGYRNELLEEKWDGGKVREKICGGDCDATQASAPNAPEAFDTQSVRTSDDAQFPALAELEQGLSSLPANTKLIAVLMPPYASRLPSTQAESDRIKQCKLKIASLVGRDHGELVDFSIRSAWTTKVDNFWDLDHFRVGLAQQLVLRLKQAEEERSDAADGVYQILTPRDEKAMR